MSAADRWDDSDGLFRLVAAATDPMPIAAVPPPQVSAAELRARVDARPGRLRERRRWIVLSAAAAAVVALLAGTARMLPPNQSRVTPPGQDLQARPSATGPGPGPLGLPAGSPARQALKELARLTAALGDTPRPGRYTYVHLQSWSRETTTAGVNAQVMSRDEQLWWDAAHAGRTVITRLAANPPADTVRQGLGPPEQIVYRPGQLSILYDDPSPDASLLASQFNDQEPFSNGPQAALRAVVSLYRYHDLSAAQRAAALTVLADNSAVQTHGTVTDRAGRPALAVSVDSDHGTTRDILLLNPATGSLLGYERQRLTVASPMRPQPAATVTDYVLFLTSSHTKLDR